jgi:2-phosphoglycerate kinase
MHKELSANNKIKIFIYGVPGTGKTFLSQILARTLEVEVVEGDKIKAKLRKGKSKDDFPFLFLGTCLAYKFYGDLNQSNVIKGLMSVREALKDAVVSEIKIKETFILESAFLDPNVVNKYGKVILLTTMDESRHRTQFLTHIEKILDFRGNEFRSARIVQDYLISEAKNLNIKIIDNDQIIGKDEIQIFKILELPYQS